MATNKNRDKEELVGMLFSMLSNHRNTRRTNNDSFLKKTFSLIDGSPTFLNAIASMGAVSLFDAVSSEYITKEQADAVIKSKGSDGQDVSIAKGVQVNDIFGQTADFVESVSNQFEEFADSLSSIGRDDSDQPLTKEQMQQKMSQIDAIANVVSSKEEISPTDPSVDVEYVGPSQQDSPDMMQQDAAKLAQDSTIILSPTDAPHSHFVQPVNTAVTIEQPHMSVDVNHAPDASMYGDYSALALALAYTAAAKGIKSFPNIGKIFQSERNLPELMGDPSYSEVLVSYANKMKKLSSEDECLDFIANRMFSGDNLRNFEKVLTFSINITENRIQRSGMNALLYSSNKRFHENIASESAEVTRALLAYDNEANSMHKSISAFTANSYDIAEMLISEHKTLGSTFESTYPDVFALMEDSGIFSELDNGFVSKILTKSKQTLGIDNKDILARSRLTLEVRSFGMSLNKEGKSCDEVRKAMVNSLAKIAKAAGNRSGLSQEQAESISRVAIGVKGLSDYVGVKKNAPIPSRPTP